MTSLSVCLSASISPKLHVRSSPNFYACYLCPLLGRILAALLYVIYFRSGLWVTSCLCIMARNRRLNSDSIGFITVAYTQTGPPGGSTKMTRPGRSLICHWPWLDPPLAALRHVMHISGLWTIIHNRSDKGDASRAPIAASCRHPQEYCE